ncbi:hypothetical protein K492DRAFT_198744 [Lichtheimia hyalospora FSU 10163]|nr:hypothetical protein K492DRAFT_198744 [Lichtheimia hyalospora FSU 10163]
MEPAETHVGWVVFELGYAHDRYINFVLYPQQNVINNGINCKARLVDVLKSDLRSFLTHGGMCKTIVRGVRCDALQEEPGWTAQPRNIFIRGNWLTLERGTEYFGDDIALMLEDDHGDSDDDDSYNKVKHESMELVDERKTSDQTKDNGTEED